MNTPTVLFEDTDLLLVNKPAGITVNRADTTKGEQTIQDWIELRLDAGNLNLDTEARGSKIEKNQPSSFQSQNLASSIQSPASEFINRAGIVHRLDKETSGILIVAKNPFAFENLQKQFKERVVKKEYIALVHGEVIPRNGEINVPVGRLEFNRKRFGVVVGGRDSVTRYRVISNLIRQPADQISNEKFTLLELYPQTGRTHQIRVHAKYINHPVFSDELYAGRKTARKDRKLLPRLFLHAAKISFLHPTTGGEVHFESPLPEDLKSVLESFTSLNEFV